jgi:hypothetical protein
MIYMSSVLRRSFKPRREAVVVREAKFTEWERAVGLISGEVEVEPAPNSYCPV